MTGRLDSDAQPTAVAAPTASSPTLALAPKRRDPEFWIAIGALGVSALAMFASLLQFTVQRSQERAAAWPHISQSRTFSAKGFAFVVQNKGMGPALVRRVDIHLDGKRVDGWPDVLDALFGPGHPYGWDRVGATDVQDRVLAPGETVQAFRIPWSTPDGKDDPRVREAFGNASRFTMVACYCSVLGDCWVTREGIDHESVSVCPVPPAS